MKGSVLDSISTFPSFAIWFAIGILMLCLFVFVYVRITPWKEFELIKDGNLAASISLFGAMTGFTLAIGSAASHAVHWLDFAIWGGVAGLVQVSVYLFASRGFKDLVSGIPAGVAAHGVFLGGVSVVAGILNAACLVY